MLSKTGASNQQLLGTAVETHFYRKRLGMLQLNLR